MGWRYGQAIHAKNDKTHEGLINPLHVNGFSSDGGMFRTWFHTNSEETHDCIMGHWKEDDKDYPSRFGQNMRPGLGSNPNDVFDRRLKFDLTTRSDQSRRHQPEPEKITLRDGRSFYPEELKQLPCMNTPTCKSQRSHSVQSRQKNLCDICMRKQRYCQSGSARSRRTERRRQARLEDQSSSSHQMTSNELECPNAISNTGVGRMIKASKRATWRRPCLRNSTLALVGDSQVYIKPLILYNLYDITYMYCHKNNMK